MSDKQCPHGHVLRDACDACAGRDAINARDIGWAMRRVKAGGFVSRKAWRDLDTFLGLVDGFDGAALNKAGVEHAVQFEHRGTRFVARSSADGLCQPWVPLPADLLADDWQNWSAR